MSAFAFADLSGGYGSVEVVRRVTGQVAAGEVLCVLGRNGVGKTTLLKMLLGYLPYWSGSVTRESERLDGYDPAERRARGITYCPQERPVFDNLSVRDNLVLMRGDRDLARFAPYFQRFPILERRLKQHAGTLSGGERKILSITRGLGEEQPVVVLDEPTEGVQWENVLHMIDLVNARSEAGSAFIVVEQNLEFAERVAHRYLVMDQGRAVLEGTRGEIARDDILRHLHV